MYKFLILLLIILGLASCSSNTKIPDSKKEIKAPIKQSIKYWEPKAKGYKPQCMHTEGVAHLMKYMKEDTNVMVLELSQVVEYPKAVKYLKGRGVKLQCYFSASYEDWRDDADLYPEEAKGKKMDNWDELWGDFRKPSLQDFLEKRMKVAKEKGCDGIEIDNTDITFNDVGFKVTLEENMDALIELSERAHKNGLSIFLKNSVGMARELQPYFEGVNNESCQRYNECDNFVSFVVNKKPVFEIEYRKRNCKPYPGHVVHYKRGYFKKKFKVCE